MSWTPSSDNALKPYLELPHLISLAWLAYPILSLLFVAFRLQSSLSSSQDAIASAKDNLARSCLAAQKAATSTASMPRYMAVATNAQIEDAVNGTLNAARAALVLSLTIMETVINFIIDLYRSTFLCFLELVVRGGLSILISAVKEITDFIENTLGNLRTSIQNDVSSVNSAIQSAVDAINKVNPFADIKAPQFNIPSLDALANVTIPTDFEDALVKLNASIPSVSEIKDKVESLIDTPFELVKKEINDTFANLTFSGSTLPVPKENTVSFCGDLDTSVIDDLGADLIKTARIGVVVIVLLALLLFGASCFVEWFKWRCLKNHLQYTREAWTSDPTMTHARAASPDDNHAPTMQMTDHNLMVLHNASAHPLITKLMNHCAALFRLSPTAHTRMQWLMSYVFHPPALACFLIGFFGILSVQIQLAAVGPLSERFNHRAEGAAADFSSTIAASLTGSMYNQSAEYAAEMNARIDAIQTQLDGGVFGWINTTTVSLNTTLNHFYDDVQGVVTTVFGGTILEQPAQEFIRCIIGSKVDALESALTFLHDHIVVELPRVNDTILVLDPATVQEATQPIALAAIGDSSDNKGEGSGIVGKVIASYVRSLEKERIMFAIFLAIWFFVVLMGLAVILWHARVAPALERRKQRRWIERERAGVNHFADERGFSTAGPVVRRNSSDTLSSPVDEKVRLPYLEPLPPSKARHLSFSTTPDAASTDEKRKTTRFHIPSIRRKPAPVEETVEQEVVQEREIPSEPTSRFSTPTPGTASAAWYKRLTAYLKKDNSTSPADVPPTPYTLTAPTKPWNEDEKNPSAYANVDPVPTSPPVWERFRSAHPNPATPDGLPAPLVPMPLHHAFAAPPSPQTPLQPPRVVVQSPTPTTPSDTMSSPVYYLSPDRKTRRLSAQAQMRIALGGTMSPVSRYMESKKEGGNPFASPEDERARW